MEFWGCEVTLKEENERDMRTDFLGNRPGGNGIIVAELKKSNQTARQAFTELPAYGSFLRTLFSPSSKNDIMIAINCIIITILDGKRTGRKSCSSQSWRKITIKGKRKEI